MINPCLNCGACCAFFRASFHYTEADDYSPGGVPLELTQDLNQTYRVMRGTDCKHPHCVALQGTIGLDAFCGIYPRRSSVCRAFLPAWVDGLTPNVDCDRARAKHSLPPLSPEDWRPKSTPEPDLPLRPAA
jgi:Fe-S-cluster containining protein